MYESAVYRGITRVLLFYDFGKIYGQYSALYTNTLGIR